MKDFLTNTLFEFFNWLGIDPIYGSDFIAILIAFWLIADLKNWEKKAAWQKFLNIMVVLGILTIFILFILRLFNTI